MSSNYRISHFLSSFLRPLIKRAPENCDSTEDLLSCIKSCNETKDLETSIIGSMDVAALCPSIDIDVSIDKCIELMIEDSQKYDNVDVRELGLFLALTATKTELQAHRLHKYCPTRSPKGRPPTITSSGTSKREGKC